MRCAGGAAETMNQATCPGRLRAGCSDPAGEGWQSRSKAAPCLMGSDVEEDSHPRGMALWEQWKESLRHGQEVGERELWKTLLRDAAGDRCSRAAPLSTRSVPSKAHLWRRVEQVKGGFAFGEFLSESYIQAGRPLQMLVIVF